MKVVSAQAMAELERIAYSQGCKEIDFMENAGRGIAFAVRDYIHQHHLPHTVWLLCGKGNNGGDAFVAGCYLLDLGYQVTAIQIEDFEHCSPLCQRNGKRFLEKKGKIAKQIENFGSEGIILDGLFGTGFKGKVKDPYASLIELANNSRLPILAIDISSGLDGTTGRVEGSVIKADETLFLGLAKTGFFLEDGWNYTGKLTHVDFGLPCALVDQAIPEFLLNTQDRMAALLPPIKRNRHKYQAGYVIGLAGSPTMPGAALLSCLAAYRGGSGMVRLLHPKGMEAQLAASPYELIKIPYTYDKPDEVLELMKKASATFVGPGLGRESEVKALLNSVLPSLEKPCVIDADALFLYAEGGFKLPLHSVLTPHTGEMQTLLKSQEKLKLNQELLHTCQGYAERHNSTLVLKGAPTFIFHPGMPITANPTGDPGMATGGSGDVLTGLIASLLSQCLNCHSAALLGVYLHGLAGEVAAKKRGTSYGMMAGDLIEHFGEAILCMENSRIKSAFNVIC